MGNIVHRYKKERYLSKNNQNIKRVELISSIFTQSKIIVPFRDPIQHSYSLLIQHEKFIKDSRIDKFISKYMKWIGHTEFGPNYIPIHKQNLNFPNALEINHWIEQWYFIYSKCLKNLENKKNVYFISYEKLCNSRDYWLKILKTLGINNFYEFQFKESQKKINLDIDTDLKHRTLSLYSKLNKIC